MMPFVIKGWGIWKKTKESAKVTERFQSMPD